MWKAGQLVTIRGIVFRVKKRCTENRFVPPCIICDIPHTFNPIHKQNICFKVCFYRKLPVNCYLRRILPKKVMG